MSDSISRRDFLKGSIALGTFALAAPLLDGLWIPPAAAKTLKRKARPLLGPDELRRVLMTALSHGGDYADVFYQSSRSHSLLLKNEKIRSAQVIITQGVGIRVIRGEKVGFAYSDDLSMQALLEAARTAAFIAGNATKPVPPIRIQPITVPNHYRIGIDPQGVDARRKVALVKRASQAAKDFDHRIVTADAILHDSKSIIAVLNSDGHYATDENVLCRMRVSAVASEKGEKSDGGFGGGGRGGLEYYEKLTPEAIAKEAARQAVVQLGAGEAPTGELPVIIGNGWGGVLLHEAVGHGLEADFNRKKTSLFAGKIGKQVASDLVTIVDDGTVLNGRGTINVDDEGTKSQRTTLIQDGTLVNYMYDRHNAALMKTKSTGNGRRESYRHLPQCRMTNTYMLPGDHEVSDMISSTEKGFYAKNLSGGQVDITNGNFVFSVTEGYLIEKGQLTRPVKGATLIGNGPDAMTKVDMVGKDFAPDTGMGTCGKGGQSMPVGLGMPTVKITAMTVGGKG